MESVMGENHTIGNIMGITMDKLKEMVDVNTIIGDPIQLQNCHYSYIKGFFWICFGRF